MKMTTTASIAALAALAILATLIAALWAAPAPAAEMALAQNYQQRQIGPGDGPKAKPQLWYLSGALTMDGSTRELKYMVPDQVEGRPIMAVLTFASKAECEDALASDDEIMQYAEWFKAHIAEQGGALAFSCLPWIERIPGQDV